jgi:hypothetical protein
MGEKTIKEHIISYTKNKYYFHINDLKKYFNEKSIEFKEDSLKKSIYRLKKENVITEAGRGWYSTVREEFILDKKPIEKVTSLIKKRFPLLGFSCWSTEQLKSFYHHLPSQFVIFIYADKDFLQSLKDFLSANGFNVYLNPIESEVEKYVELDNQTVVLRPLISYREPENQYWNKIEKIIVDLYMETKRVNLMDMEEYKKLISNIILNYRINIAMVLDYAHNRKIKDKIENIIVNLNESTNATLL